jgi:Amt family ammonium transporter
MEALKSGSDVLFILLGGIMVLAMHSGFAFLELGTVRKKSQVNALVKILTDFSVSTIAYFFIGYSIAYGINFFSGAETLLQKNGYELTKFFFLLTFAAAIPAIVSGGIAERAKFYPQLAATFLIVAFIYPFFEGIAWNQAFGIQAWLKATYGEEFHDFAGSVVVHAMGGWIALPAVLLLGARHGRYNEGGRNFRTPAVIDPLSGAWRLDSDRRLVRLQRHERADDRQDLRPGGHELADGHGRRHAGGSGGGQERPRLRAQRPARRSGRRLCRLRRDAPDRRTGRWWRRRRHVRGDVHADPEPLEDRRCPRRLAAAWPLRRLGRYRRRHFRQPALGGVGGVAFMPQLLMTALAIAIALVGSCLVYGVLKAAVGLRLDQEQEYNGADLSIHKITANPSASPTGRSRGHRHALRDTARPAAGTARVPIALRANAEFRAAGGFRRGSALHPPAT